MNVCKFCKYWKEIGLNEWYGSNSFLNIAMGQCQSNNIKHDPNYYEDYEGEASDDMALTTYSFHTGSNFSCIHFERE